MRFVKYAWFFFQVGLAGLGVVPTIFGIKGIHRIADGSWPHKIDHLGLRIVAQVFAVDRIFIGEANNAVGKMCFVVVEVIFPHIAGKGVGAVNNFPETIVVANVQVHVVIQRVGVKRYLVIHQLYIVYGLCKTAVAIVINFSCIKVQRVALVNMYIAKSIYAVRLIVGISTVAVQQNIFMTDDYVVDQALGIGNVFALFQCFSLNDFHAFLFLRESFCGNKQKEKKENCRGKFAQRGAGINTVKRH